MSALIWSGSGSGSGFLISNLLLVLALCLQYFPHVAYAASAADYRVKIKSAVFLSPEFVMKPGSVVDRYYYNIDFPKGHVALKSFDAQVVDEAGVPVPLHETYLHHWVVARYYQRIGVPLISEAEPPQNSSDLMLVRNSGICQGNSLAQYFGLGSETRRTATHVPDPYGIEIGNPVEIPAGFEEGWMLNIHAIDTRDVVDTSGCTECRCHLYNVTKDQHGRPLRPGYIGGLSCCYDKTQCRLRRDQGLATTRRSLYLRYTVKWVEWDDAILPVNIYILDVTDAPMRFMDAAENINSVKHQCKVEYDVEPCKSVEVYGSGRCINSKKTSLIMPRGGYVVYGVAHQHSGGIGSALYGEDGRVICSSIPTYGTGKEAGNETGYIVGMSTCYPEPGSMQIMSGETLLLESNYTSAEKHTGVMGLFYILLADQVPVRFHLSLLIQIFLNSSAIMLANVLST
ncbi:hypothetical protein Dimus_023642 [Dionaea muscipula]